MPDHSTYFEASGGGMVLTNAILLYRREAQRGISSHGANRPDAPAFASLHPVVHDDEGRPSIGAGSPMTRAHLRHWTAMLGRAVLPEILPPNVLVAHPDMLVWWIPAQVRAGYFALSDPPPGLRVLSERTVLPVPYPPHLFIATRSALAVYALPADERPTAQTSLLHSPILNVYRNGKLCWGNVPQPKSLALATIPEFERAVFDSWSTHPNIGQELTVTGKGGLVRLWDNLAARRAGTFPVKRLRPFLARSASGGTATEAVTVGRLVAANTRR